MRIIKLLSLAIALGIAALPAVVSHAALAGDGDPVVKQDKGK